MIYDCFTFFNELELLDIRLHELSGVVDKFVLVEASQTFSGQKKPLFFQQNKQKFAKYLSQIIHVVVDDFDAASDAWNLPYFSKHSFQMGNIKTWSKEIYQRNAIMRGLTNCSNNDIVLISDIDEIPRSSKVKNLKITQGICAFEQTQFNYYYNCKGKEPWYGTRAALYNKNLIPEIIRSSQAYTIIPNGGWHFSFIGGEKTIQQKVKAYSHQEYNTPEYLDTKRIQMNMVNGLDLFERPFAYSFVKIDKTFPSFLQTNQHKYAKNIKKITAIDANTSWLHDELFASRSKLYWKNMEVKAIQEKLEEYQRKYREAIKYNPLYYIVSKLKKR